MTQRIGRHEIVRRIAVGGMAEVFEARFVGPGGFEKPCAIKRILPNLSEQRRFRELFLTEARLSALLTHPNIVQMFELGETPNGDLYAVMELVDGCTLRQVLNRLSDASPDGRGRLPPGLAAHITCEVLAALEYAHDFCGEDGQPLGVIHRDVSPRNIMLTRTGGVKLLDFGVAKANGLGEETGTGVLKGKASYMAPEQIVRGPIDRRSDLFALGVVLFEALTGAHPFRRETDFLTLHATIQDAPFPPTSIVPDLPTALVTVLETALDKDPDLRFPTAADFAAPLKAELARQPTSVGTEAIRQLVASVDQPGERTTATAREPSPLPVVQVARAAAPAPARAHLDVDEESQVIGMGRSASRAPLGLAALLLAGLALLGFVASEQVAPPPSIPFEQMAQAAEEQPTPDPTPSGKEEKPHRRRSPPRRPTASIPAGFGKVRLTSSPAGLVVLLDGERVGRTPLEVTTAPGDRRLVLMSDARAIRKAIDVRVREGATALLDVEIGTGTLEVRADEDAQIYVDGRLKGRTRLRDLLFEGPHVLRVVSADGKERVERFRIDGGESKAIEARL